MGVHPESGDAHPGLLLSCQRSALAQRELEPRAFSEERPSIVKDEAQMPSTTSEPRRPLACHSSNCSRACATSFSTTLRASALASVLWKRA